MFWTIQLCSGPISTYVDLIVMQRSCSSLRVSVKRVSPARDEAMIPALDTSESVSVDFPWSTWAITDMFRMLDFLSMMARIWSTVKLTCGEWVKCHMLHSFTHNQPQSFTLFIVRFYLCYVACVHRRSRQSYKKKDMSETEPRGKEVVGGGKAQILPYGWSNKSEITDSPYTCSSPKSRTGPLSKISVF